MTNGKRKPWPQAPTDVKKGTWTILADVEPDVNEDIVAMVEFDGKLVVATSKGKIYVWREI